MALLSELLIRVNAQTTPKRDRRTTPPWLAVLWINVIGGVGGRWALNRQAQGPLSDVPTPRSAFAIHCQRTPQIAPPFARAAAKALCHLLLLAAICGLALGCSFKKLAANKLGDALAAGGSTFSSDEDAELVKAAVPFSLKLMESLLAESPKHRGLLFATSSGFTQYAYAFVQQEADELEEKDLSAATEMRERAGKLYLRARNYGLRGLEVKHRGFEQALRSNPKAAIHTASLSDVPLLYWTAASWAAAVSLAKDDPNLIADLPLVEALIDRALELDEQFDHGAIHSFLIPFEMSRPTSPGDAEARARTHFKRSVELSGGQLAGPFVCLAESVSVQKQNLAEFKDLLNRGLAINPDLRPEWRVVNLVMQRRARWLLGQTEDLFLEKPQTKKP
jgi:predicted anti-sigma-YlaC factor YlaD